jgi:uncharacterized membrane protein YqhA
MLRTLLAATRYLVLVPIIGIFAAACGLMVYEAFVLVAAFLDLVNAGAPPAPDAKKMAVELIQIVDIFLIAIAMYIISINLYALFIDDAVPLPRWLAVHDLEAVKSNLVSVVIAVLAVLFLREAVAWDGGRDILGFGTALGLVIAALGLFLRVHRHE